MRGPRATQIANMTVKRVKYVREEGAILHDMILQQGAQVLDPMGRKEKGVCFRAQVVEGCVGRCEDGDALIGVFERRGEAGLEEG